MSDQAHELRELVRRDSVLAANDAQTRPWFLAVSGGRDGVGTTTIALGLAAAAVQAGRRVLLVDADPKRGDVAAICQIEERCTLADVLVARRSVREAIQPGPAGIWILPGGWAGNLSDEQKQSTTDLFQSRLSQPLKILGDRFDLIVIDAGNGANRETIERWRAADAVILVTTPDLPAIMDSYAAIKHSWTKQRPPLVNCLVNMADDEETAADVQARLERSCRRFLGLHLRDAGYLPLDATAAQGIAKEHNTLPFPTATGATVSEKLSSLIKTLLSENAVCSSGFGRNGSLAAVSGRAISA